MLIPILIIILTGMDEYKHKSHEELRFEHWTSQNKVTAASHVNDVHPITQSNLNDVYSYFQERYIIIMILIIIIIINYLQCNLG